MIRLSVQSEHCLAERDVQPVPGGRGVVVGQVLDVCLRGQRQHSHQFFTRIDLRNYFILITNVYKTIQFPLQVTLPY